MILPDKMRVLVYWDVLHFNKKWTLWDWQFIFADAGAENHHLKNSELYHMQCESLYVAKLRSPWWCLSRWIIIRSNCLIENSDRLPLTVRVHTCNLCICFRGWPLQRVPRNNLGGRTSKQEWQSTPGTEVEEQQLIPVYSTWWMCWKTFHIIHQILLFNISFMVVHLIFS